MVSYDFTVHFKMYTFYFLFILLLFQTCQISASATATSQLLKVTESQRFVTALDPRYLRWTGPPMAYTPSIPKRYTHTENAKTCFKIIRKKSILCNHTFLKKVRISNMPLFQMLQHPYIYVLLPRLISSCGGQWCTL